MKPVRETELIDAVTAVLGARRLPGTPPLMTKYTVAEMRAHAPPPNPEPEPEEGEQEEPASALRVLLAEDTLVTQKVATRMLTKIRCMVDVAVNGEEAVARSAQRECDVIFMDCQMPVLDGYAATGLIRAREQDLGRCTLIVAMTANAMTGDREKCLQAGMEDYLSKPVSARMLEIPRSMVSRGARALTASARVVRQPDDRAPSPRLHGVDVEKVLPHSRRTLHVSRLRHQEVGTHPVFRLDPLQPRLLGGAT